MRLVIGKDFPSFESIGSWARFNLLLQADLDKLKRRELPADLRVDLACELIQACLQEKPEDRWIGGLKSNLHNSAIYLPVLML